MDLGRMVPTALVVFIRAITLVTCQIGCHIIVLWRLNQCKLGKRKKNEGEWAPFWILHFTGNIKFTSTEPFWTGPKMGWTPVDKPSNKNRWTESRTMVMHCPNEKVCLWEQTPRWQQEQVMLNIYFWTTVHNKSEGNGIKTRHRAANLPVFCSPKLHLKPPPELGSKHVPWSLKL